MDLSEWLGAREPTPPGDLAEACMEVGRIGPDSGPMACALRDAAADRLASALERPGRVRQSAFDLLVADALVTYACESALEAVDLEAALGDIARIGGDSLGRAGQPSTSARPADGTTGPVAGPRGFR